MSVIEIERNKKNAKRLAANIFKSFKYDPTECQQNLFAQASTFLYSDDDILVVNGYAGTGKTTAVSSIINAWRAEYNRVVLLAPTGRAAKVLSSYSHRRASTIHRHIYQQKSISSTGVGSFKLCNNNYEDTLFIVDEVSLIGIGVDSPGGSDYAAAFGTGNLLEDLITYVRDGEDCKLIMIGDSAQLPPVGHESSPALSKSYMDGFGSVQWCTMTSVVRQGQESGILSNATEIRDKIVDYTEHFGFMPDDDFHISMDVDAFPDIERIKGSQIIEYLEDAYSEYGEEETIVLCRSNKKANIYNRGIRAQVQFKEDLLTSSDKLMIVKNCYEFLDKVKEMDYIANGDIATLDRVYNFEEKYGLHYADALLSFPDYDNIQLEVKIILDTLLSESPSLPFKQQQELYQSLSNLAEYKNLSKRKKYEKIKSDPYFAALQIKYANAITCHKSQGGQWKCVFIDCPFWRPNLTIEDLKWLYTAITRGIEKVYLVNFNNSFFKTPFED